MNSYFENPTIGLRVLYLLNIHANRMYFTIWSMNSSFMHYFNGKKFLFTFEREREREREREYKRMKFLNFRLPFWSWKCYHFFYRYNCLENKDRPFLYRMYIKGFFFLDCKQKVHLKNTNFYMFMCFFLFFFLNVRIILCPKKINILMIFCEGQLWPSQII